MSAESLRTFHAKVDAGATIVWSRYEDSAGTWAKDEDFVDRVRVKWNDGETTFLEYAEVKQLSKERRDLIDLAPSSPPEEL